MRRKLLSKAAIGFLTFIMMSAAHASIPIWTYTPLTATTHEVPDTGTATVRYTVQNQSNKAKQLVLSPTPGVQQIAPCNLSPKGQSGDTCVLNLLITGSALPAAGITGGPFLCQANPNGSPNPNQCYQPSSAYILRITKGSPTPPPIAFIVTPSGDGNVTISPSTSQTVNSGLSQAFTVIANSGYVLSQTVGGSCPVGSWSGNTYTTGPITSSCSVTFIGVTVPPGATTLSTSIPSPSILALSVNKPTLNPALTGNARQITITNTGTNEATGLNIAYPTWPGGTPATTTSSTCGATLAAGATCVITITPGANATSTCTTGIAPTPGTITVNATNANPVSTNVVVLGYGCIYQEGYVYAVDDNPTTAPITGSIGGKAVSLTNQAPRFPGGVIWSSNSSGTYDGGVAIYGIADTSTTASPVPNAGQIAGQLPSIGRTDGSRNSNNIVVYYSPPQTNPAITSSFYAAGRCSAYSVGIYNDWYLPAICEMGPCIVGTQNIVSNLPSLLGNPTFNPDTSCVFGVNCLTGYYWSSTEVAGNPANEVWGQAFASGGGSSFQLNITKDRTFGVRCSRALTL